MQTSESVHRAYRRYAWAYDFVFGPALAIGRRAAIQALECAPGERILEIGVGTGLSLPLYPAQALLTGVDLSPEMLGRARARAGRLGRAADLREMDAQSLEFPGSSFDKCVAMYVASVAPDPAALVREMRRVTRKGGRLVLVNHFSRRGSLAERGERFLARFARGLGWEPLFHLDEFVKKTGLEGAKVKPVGPMGFWAVLSLDL